MNASLDLRSVELYVHAGDCVSTGMAPRGTKTRQLDGVQESVCLVRVATRGTPCEGQILWNPIEARPPRERRKKLIFLARDRWINRSACASSDSDYHHLAQSFWSLVSGSEDFPPANVEFSSDGIIKILRQWQKP